MLGRKKMCLRTLQLECWNCVSYFLPPGLATNSAIEEEKEKVMLAIQTMTPCPGGPGMARIHSSCLHASRREQELSLMDEIG